jgi:hypothetical protein
VLANQALKAVGIDKQLRIARTLRSAGSLNRLTGRVEAGYDFGNQVGANVTVQRRPHYAVTGDDYGDYSGTRTRSQIEETPAAGAADGPGRTQ